MSDRNLEALNERERVCLTHLRQAQELGLSFSRYCRERDLKFQQWAWVKRVLIRKGVIGGRRWVGKAKAVGFAPVRVAPPEAAATVCRIRHPSGWTIECASFPEVSWMSALMSGAAA
jgi:hypothetical protein